MFSCTCRKPAPAVFAPQPAGTQQPRGHSHSARRHPPPKRQGPRPKITLDPAPPASSWSAGQEEERVESRHGRTAHQKASHEKPLGTPFFSGCRGNCVCCYRVRTSDHATVRCDSGKIKHKHSQKESNFPLPSLTSALPPCSRPLEFIQPLATRAEAWQAIPGVSEWVMGIIKRGYSLQFARRPPRFSGVVSTSVQGENARVLRSEVMTLLEKGAIEMVSPALSESGFYSRYFLIPKKDGGLRPILDLRRLNHALMRRPFRMITLKQILSQIRTEDWFCSLDLKDAYFHIQIAPHHRRFLRFAFEGVAYQYTVLPFGLSLAPRTFTKCMDAALSPLRQMGIRILNYLDDWLILAQSEVELLSHRTLILSHFRAPGTISPERALAIQKLAATFKSDTTRPLKVFQRMLGLMAAASPVLQLGLLRMRPLQHWLKPRVPHNAWRHGRLHIRVNQACVTALTPWKNPRTHKCEGKPTFGHWSKTESGFHINCLDMLAVCRACQFFQPDLIGRHVLIRSDKMSVVSYINHQGGVSSKRLFILAERLLEWAQLNLRSSAQSAHLPGRQKERICYLGAMSPQRSGCSIRRWFRRYGRPLARQK